MLCVGVSESWCPAIITHADGIGCLAHRRRNSPLNMSLYGWLPIGSQSWTRPECWGYLDLAEPRLLRLELDPGASCTQRHGKFASGDGFQVLSLLDFP